MAFERSLEQIELWILDNDKLEQSVTVLSPFDSVIFRTVANVVPVLRVSAVGNVCTTVGATEAVVKYGIGAVTSQQISGLFR